MESGPSLPLLVEPLDPLRHGLVSLKEESLSAHPVQTIIKKSIARQEETKRNLLERVYGSALPMKMEIEHKILSRSLRLPGLPSSQFSLETYTGSTMSFGFEDYLGDPNNSEYVKQQDFHVTMENRLGISPSITG